MSLAASSPAIVTPTVRLRGRLRMPSDKSIAHRALILAALSGGPSTVALDRPGRDVLSTVACLRALGVRATDDRGRWTVAGLPSSDATLDCGNSGTTMRLLAGAVAGFPLRVTVDGDESLRARPMERVATLLRDAGADVTTSDGYPPLSVGGTRPLRAVDHHLPVASAQLIGAAAMAALTAEGETRIESPGPTRDHTERLLAWVGVPARREGSVTTVVGPATIRPFDLEVPGDPSSAAAWLVAGALHRRADLVIEGVGLNPTRLAVVDVLRRMGADVTAEVTSTAGPEPLGDLRVRGGRGLRATVVGRDEASAVIDELPLLAVAMAAAEGRSEVRGAGELRVKESDRIGAVAAALRAIGAVVEERADGWAIERGNPRVARIETRGDHRVAMAMAVAAATGVAEGVELDDSRCVDVSYPGFFDDLEAVTA